MIQNTEIAKCIQSMESFLIKQGYKKFQLFVADSNYFDLDLEQRRDLLKANSVDQLCKSIIMENTAYDKQFEDAIYYPKYICIVIQYISKLQGEKINKYYKDFQNKQFPNKKAPRSKFHFRLTSEEKSVELSGYTFNAITPFNFNQEMPILISNRLVNLEYLWFGGGHKEVKLRMDIQELINISKGQLCDIVY